MLSIFAQAEVGEKKHPVPIAVSGTASGVPSDCEAGRSCQGELLRGKPFLFAARFFPGSTLRVGIYPRDICLAVDELAGASAARGCNASTVKEPKAGESVTLPLVFTLGGAKDASSALEEVGSEKATLNLVWEAEGPDFSCPSDFSEAYFPGDGLILLQLKGFSGKPKAAPVRQLVVLAKEGSPPNTTADGYSKNEVVARQPLSEEQTETIVGGFVNTTDGNDHKYQLLFSVRDTAGAFGAFKPTC